MDAAIIIIGASTVVATLWFAVCNDMTFRQRMKMISIVHNHNIEKIEARRFRERHAYPDNFLSYNAHLFRLFVFMSPKKAYAKRGWSLGF